MKPKFWYASILLILLNLPGSLPGADDSDRSPDVLHLLDGTVVRGLIIKNSRDSVLIQQETGELDIPKSNIVAIISGLTDLDAITLSTGQLADSDKIEASIAWRVILVALLSNLLFKFGIVAALGPASLTKRLGLATAAAVAAGIGILLLWPGEVGSN